MAWSPGFMESQNYIKGSFTKKSQSYSSWTEDEGNKEVSGQWRGELSSVSL